MIIFDRDRLQPDFGNHVAVNDVDVRWFDRVPTSKT